MFLAYVYKFMTDDFLQCIVGMQLPVNKNRITK